ncbi:hypothetical protein KCM76_24960, partial [Zooshikella marina]
MEKFSKKELNFLVHLFECNVIKYDQAIQWCYDNFGENTPDWLEKASLSVSLSELAGIIREEFLLYEYSISPEDSFSEVGY